MSLGFGAGDPPKARTNGFELPFHPQQILGWFVFGLDVLLYSVFALPLVCPVALQTVVATCFFASVGVLVIGAASTTGCNPADPQTFKSKSKVDAKDWDIFPYCSVCSVPVYPRSKHCPECNKCVAVFDHHCLWLNNCIGSANYNAFFATIFAVAAMVAILLGTCCYLVVGFINGDIRIDDISFSIFWTIPSEVHFVVHCVLIAVNGPLFLLDLQLIFLHTYFISQNITTYEYIVSKREQQESIENIEDSQEESLKEYFSRRIVKPVLRCADWTVLRQCGRKRRRRKNKASHNTERNLASSNEEPSAAPVAVGANDLAGLDLDDVVLELRGARTAVPRLSTSGASVSAGSIRKPAQQIAPSACEVSLGRCTSERDHVFHSRADAISWASTADEVSECSVAGNGGDLPELLTPSAAARVEAGGRAASVKPVQLGHASGRSIGLGVCGLEACVAMMMVPHHGFGRPRGNTFSPNSRHSGSPFAP